MASGKQQTIHITIPLHEQNGRVESLFVQFLDNIHNSINQEVISLEVVSVHQHINFYMTFPIEIYEFMVGQVYALYPDAEILKTQDFINAQSLAGLSFYGAELGLTRSNLYPTQTYDMFEKDPISGLYSIMAKVFQNEQAWVQIVIKKVPDTWKFHFHNKIGRRIHRVKRIFKIRDRMKLGSGADAHATEKQWFDSKVNHNMFSCSLRVMYLAKTEQLAKQKLYSLARGFFQINNSDLNEYRITSTSKNKAMLKKFKNRLQNDDFRLNIKELATAYHLPNPDEISNVVYVISRKNEPPLDLPKPTPENAHEMSYFGKTNYHNSNIPFGIYRKDRRRHLYTVGKSGSGKSKLLELLINEDIRYGHGVAVLDPHGDLVDNVMRMIPEHRKKDVIYFDPGDIKFPIAFNLLEDVGEKQKMQVTIGFIEIFKKLFGSNWSDRLEHVLRYTTLALLDTKGTTVFSILKMLTDKNYRQMIVRGIQDDVVKNFWVNEFAGWSEKFDSEAITPLLNKVGQFVSTNMIRNIVGQPNNTFDMRDIMDNKKILLLKISKGLLGEENAQLIGAMVITKIYQAAMARADMREEDRQDFYFYVDEFHNFATDSFAEILSEARKYRLNMTLAHQYMGQLNDVVRKTVFGNVGSFISFRVGAEDAAVMAQEFNPIFNVRDILNLGVRDFYTKMSVNGSIRDPFSGRTIRLDYPEVDFSEDIKNYSRKKYCRPLAEVKAILSKWEEHTEAPAKPGTSNIKEAPVFEAPLV